MSGGNSTDSQAATDAELEQAFDLFEHKEFDRAAALCRKIAAAAPQNAVAFQILGLSAMELGQFHESIAALTAALALQPDIAEAHNAWGLAHLRLGRYEHALAGYDRALALAADFAEAHNNRGAVLVQLGRVAEGVASYGAAIAADPDYVEAHYNLGMAEIGRRRWRAAIPSLRAAVDRAPGFTAAHFSLALALESSGDFEESLAALTRVLELDPNHVDALRARGKLLQLINRHEEAIAAFDRLRAAEVPAPPAVKTEAMWRAIDARLICCDWSAYDGPIAAAHRLVADGEFGVQPFCYLAYSHSPALEQRCARTYTRQLCAGVSAPLWRGERYDHGKIRIAYLSSDFRDHAVGYLIADLLERHDRTRFEITGISFWPDDGGTTRPRIVKAFDRFIDVVDRDDAEVAALIRELEIDILVHLNGHTEPGHLPILAHRPAPVQVNFLGYPGTIGADFADYIIADRHVLPPGEEKFYDEKVVWLPDAYQPNDGTRPIAAPPTRAAAGLPAQGFVFCAFNRSVKISPAVFDVWMNLLRKVEGSVLWLLVNNPAVPRNLRREAARRGVDPARLVFAPFKPIAEHLPRYALADLYLDTLPYNGHTTASDALWAGVPVLTCQGTNFAGRVAASLLHAIGLPEMIAASLVDYEARALAFAHDPAALARVKTRLLHNRSTHPLFDTPRYRRHLESAYIEMWRRAQNGEPPADFAVAPIA